MRAAEGFTNDLIDDPQLEQVWGSRFIAFGCLWCVLAFVFPYNTATGFRGCDAIDSVFHHQDTVSDSNG